MLSIVLLALSAAATAAAQQAQPGDAATTCVARGGGSTAKRGAICYEFFEEEVVWTDARDRCHQYNASLVSVTSDDVQRWLVTAIEQLLPSRTGVWIGLNDRRDEGTFMWDDVSSTGLEARYFNWYTGEPNDLNLGQDCVYMRKTFQWRWVDVECALSLRSYSFVCEIGRRVSAIDRVIKDETTLSTRDRSGDVSSDSGAKVNQAAGPNDASPFDKEAKDKTTVRKISEDSRSPATGAIYASADSEQRRTTVNDGQLEEWQIRAQEAVPDLTTFGCKLPSNHLWFTVLVLPALVGGALLAYLLVYRNPARLARLKAAAIATLGRRYEGGATKTAVPPAKDDVESKSYLLAEAERQSSSGAVRQQTRSNSRGGNRAVPNIYVTFGEATAALSVPPSYGGSDDGPVYADLVEPLP